MGVSRMFPTGMLGRNFDLTEITRTWEVYGKLDRLGTLEGSKIFSSMYLGEICAGYELKREH
jgi:hypothetical protein